MGKTNIDVWSTEQIFMFTQYALGNDATVKDILNYNNIAFNIIVSLMNDKHSNSLIRERIVANLENLKHNFQMHKYDAFDSELNEDVEEKNEQHSRSDSRRNQVTGGGVFGVEEYSNIEKLITDNPRLYLSGWIDGRLAYTVSFKFNDSTISTRLTRALKQKIEENKKTAPKFLWSDWINATSLKVTYFNPVYFHELRPYVSKELMNKIELKHSEQLM